MQTNPNLYEVNDMHFELPHCIERLTKAGRVVIISKSVVRISDIDRSRRLIPFGQTRLTEYREEKNR